MPDIARRTYGSSFSMKTRYCIVGATRGTGLLIAQQLLQSGLSVRIVVRNPEKASRLLGNQVDIIYGDVTDARSVRDAIAEDYKAIFFTVAATGGMDGRGLFGSQTAIREVTYQGLLNVVEAARSRSFNGRIILPSVVGVDRSSVMIRLLDKIKPGLQQNLTKRELYLRTSGLDYTIVRAPILINAPAGKRNIHIIKAISKLTAGSKISRGDLARILILASQQTVASGKTFELFAAKGDAPSDEKLLKQLEEILPYPELR
jgi:nucleoside-diphosphate-sugar epimerase